MVENWLDEDTDLKSAGPERALGVRVPPLPPNACVVELADTSDLGSDARAWGFKSLHRYTLRK